MPGCKGVNFSKNLVSENFMSYTEYQQQGDYGRHSFVNVLVRKAVSDFGGEKKKDPGNGRITLCVLIGIA